jgi:hypothetical protein
MTTVAGCSRDGRGTALPRLPRHRLPPYGRARLRDASLSPQVDPLPRLLPAPPSRSEGSPRSERALLSRNATLKPEPWSAIRRERIASVFDNGVPGYPWKRRAADRLAALLTAMGWPSVVTLAGVPPEDVITVEIPETLPLARRYTSLNVCGLRSFGLVRRGSDFAIYCFWSDPEEAKRRVREIEIWRNEPDTEFEPFPPDVSGRLAARGLWFTLPQRMAATLDAMLQDANEQEPS